MSKSWSCLCGRLAEVNLLKTVYGDDKQLFVDHLAHDSREVKAGGIFVAIRGEKTDGHLFIDKAVKNEATAVVCEVMPGEASARFPGIAFAQVCDARAALAALAAVFHDDPAAEMRLVGVTGTNGKSTVVHLMHFMLTHLAGNTGLLGTIEYRLGGPPESSSHTTPDALHLHYMLRRMVDAGCTTCVMEVSSHALVQQRTWGIPFDVAAFTNLTQDHLDYHATPEAYLAAKKKLFDELPREAVAIYNSDDAAGRQVVASTAAKKLSYGQSKDADIQLEILEGDMHGLRLRLDGHVCRFSLVGRFNAYNLAVAYATARALGWDALSALGALSGASSPPGRFEKQVFTDGTIVIVDYAHTPDALEKALRTIRASKPEEANLWCLFGCGGDRDRDKRPSMGAVAERLSDHVIVTSDNARTEAQAQIDDDIRVGMKKPAGVRWIADRRSAIRAAARHAAPGDIVLVAGKGHETFQITGRHRSPFDDRQEVRSAFLRRGLKP